VFGDGIGGLVGSAGLAGEGATFTAWPLAKSCRSPRGELTPWPQGVDLHGVLGFVMLTEADDRAGIVHEQIDLAEPGGGSVDLLMDSNWCW